MFEPIVNDFVRRLNALVEEQARERILGALGADVSRAVAEAKPKKERSKYTAAIVDPQWRGTRWNTALLASVVRTSVRHAGIYLAQACRDGKMRRVSRGVYVRA